MSCKDYNEKGARDRAGKNCRLPAKQWVGLLAVIACILFFPTAGRAALFEQLAVNTRAMSLGNAVTADPPALLSAHYNPAGLMHVQGTEFTLGVAYIPMIDINGKFKQATDPKTGKPWAPFGGWFNNGIDPESGRESHTAGAAQLPFIGWIPLLAAPNLGFAYHNPESRWSYGVAVYAPFGAGLQHTGADDPVRFLGKRLSLLRIVTAPTIAYQVTKTFSIGASFGLGIAAMGFDSDLRAPNDMVAMTGALGDATKNLEIPIISELTLPPPWFGGGLSPYETVGKADFFCTDYIDTSYNVGFLWEPVRWFSFGGVYQSETTLDMKGTFSMQYGKSFQKVINWLGSSPLTLIIAGMLDLPTKAVKEQKGNVEVDVLLPARAQFGIKFQPIRQVKFLVDAHWAQWSAWESLKVVFDQDIQLLRLAKLMGYTLGSRTLALPNNFKDTWHFSYGMEIQPIEMLTLRLGYEPRKTSLQDSNFGPLPLPDLDIYSAGLGLDFKDVDRMKGKGILGLAKMVIPDSVDLDFTYITSDYKLPSNKSRIFNSTVFTDVIYNPFAGLNYEQKITAYVLSFNVNYKF